MQKKILVIDDEPDFRDVIKDYLELSGYLTVCAGDGDEGLKVMQTEKPDMVLLDMRMPRMNGVQVLKAMRQQDNRPVTIVISGVREDHSAREALALGAYDYLTKPLDLENFADNYLNRILS